MATARHWYTLVGFSDELDWRQLAFVEPIPPNRICKACGLVTRVTAFLPCLHVFCRNCYEQCRHDDQHSCPLDGQLTVEEDVEWIEFPVENLLKRKVKCWNEDHGCDVILPASELHKHFYKQCDCHCTSCPKCSMIVRCNNVCSHMQSECRDHVMTMAPRNPHAKTNGEKGIVMTMNANIDKRADEMKVILDHLKLENDAQSNRLDDISHCMNTFKETLLEILNKTNRFDSGTSSSEAINEALNDQAEKLQQIIGTISTSHKTLNEGLRTLEQLKQDMPSALEAHLREFFTIGSVALQETLRKEFAVTGRKGCSNCAESVGKIAGVKDCFTQADSSAINYEKCPVQ
ncbi:uncharacterized protein LOC119163899 [Rhipicephalus microplus]|uniref:uncharacterized protein LOC119163899 n=1 Tax=Rhipicephalus microplus TaxID=6941 RepID=UPI0018898B11|nr:uncharacterized protein LOC119163899 [Rhipicephalus microplus]